MILDTTYLGLSLKSPIVVSSCTLSENMDNLLQMEDCGAAAVVLFSLFEEQIGSAIAMNRSSGDSAGSDPGPTFDYFPAPDDYRVDVEQYIELIRNAKSRLGIPVIASVNCISRARWIECTRLMQEAGADAIEVNMFSLPANMTTNGHEVEDDYLQVVSSIKATVDIPVSVKLHPFFTALPQFVSRLEDHGADGIGLFNRFFQPDFDIQLMRVVPSLHYSDQHDIRLPLMWISYLHDRIGADIAATTGVNSGAEVIKFLLAGASVVMTASALYKHGISHLNVMTSQLQEWMSAMDFSSVDQFRGLMNQRAIPDPVAYERANYIRILEAI